MSYTVFSRKSLQIHSPAITISPSGRIYLNQGAVDSLISRRRIPAYALLLWNERTGRAAIQPVFTDDERAYRIHYSNKGSGATMTAKSFLNWIGFTGPSTTVLAQWNNREKALEFELSEEENIG